MSVKRKDNRTRTQYKLTWQRKDRMPRTAVYANMATVQKRIALMGPEPWQYLDVEPDDLMCCDGYMCGCLGITWREHFMQKREERGWQPIQWIKIEARKITVTPWEQVSEEGQYIEPADSDLFRPEEEGL